MTTIVKRASDVRIQEFNFSQVLVNESETIAFLPVVAKRGSPFMRHFTDPNDFLFEYGEPNPQVSMSVQCGLDYFQEGKELWGLRVIGAGAKYAALLMYQDGNTTKMMPVQEGIVDPENIDWNMLTPGSGTIPLALWYPNRGQGSYGRDYAVGIRTTNIETPTHITVQSRSSGGRLPASSYSYRVSALRKDGSETLVSAPAEIVISASGVTNAVEIKWEGDEEAIGYKIYGRIPGGGLISVVGSGTFSFIDTGSIVPDTSKQPIDDPANLAEANPQFTVQIFDTSRNTSVPVEEMVCTMGYGVDESGVQTELEDRVNPFSQFLQVKSNAAALDEFPVLTKCEYVNLGGGDSGAAPTSYDIINAIQVLRNKEKYDINLIINGGFADPSVQKAMDAIAQYRGDTVALLDVPSTKQRHQAAIDYRRLALGINSTYSALFNPDIMISDTYNKRALYVPFSGTAAALCARTDRVAGPSRSIAGLNRGQVNQALRQRYTFDDGEASAMFRAQVNYLRTFSGLNGGQGIALWEQQTLANEFSALSWLNVRRIVNVIKKSSYKYLLYALQEQNSDSLKFSIDDGLTSYLQAHKNDDAISDFTVVCDNTNNPAAVANAAILVVSVVLVPILAVHEIQLDLAISRQGLSFKEVLRRLGNAG